MLISIRKSKYYRLFSYSSYIWSVLLLLVCIFCSGTEGLLYMLFLLFGGVFFIFLVLKLCVDLSNVWKKFVQKNGTEKILFVLKQYMDIDIFQTRDLFDFMKIKDELAHKNDSEMTFEEEYNATFHETNIIHDIGVILYFAVNLFVFIVMPLFSAMFSV